MATIMPDSDWDRDSDGMVKQHREQTREDWEKRDRADRERQRQDWETREQADRERQRKDQEDRVREELKRKEDMAKKQQAAKTLKSLKVGEVMTVYDRIVSPNGKYHLILQDDSNFVLYTDITKAIWASNTWNSGIEQAVLKEDGDLSLQHVTGYLSTRWNSRTAGRGNKTCVLTVEDSGNAVIRSDGNIIWKT